MTNIEWTEQTWNPIVGCTIATKGCTNCYAMRAAYRMSHNPSTPQYHGTAKLVNGNPVWTGTMNLAPTVMLQPLKRKKPTTYFVNSMGDLFHPSVPTEWLDQAFAVMALCPHHKFQILTKRADRMREYLSCETARYRICARMKWNHKNYDIPDADKLPWPLPNVWLGVSAEDQNTANERIPQLLSTPAAVRFVSAEPLLTAIDLTLFLHESDCSIYDDNYCTCKLADVPNEATLDWVIAGGESGPSARQMHPEWVRSLRDQCSDARTPFLFKQWGEWLPFCNMNDDDAKSLYTPPPDEHPDATKKCKFENVCMKVTGEVISTGDANGFHRIPSAAFTTPGDVSIFKVGKKAAGRMLDGQMHDGMPT